jgi:hypothetical protein
MRQDRISAEITAYAPRAKTQDNAKQNNKKPKLSKSVAGHGNARILDFSFAQRGLKSHQSNAARSMLQTPHHVKRSK